MIDPASALNVLTRAGVDFFTGVPDSLLKEFNSCVMAEVSETQHVVAPNEGSAVALAAGYYLATGRIGMVYMQNSGLGNAVNPLVSLTSSVVYGLPMVLMIGWRGQPGAPDEPQHEHQGRITPEQLRLLEVPVTSLSDEVSDWTTAIEGAVAIAKETSSPSALLVSTGTFSQYQGEPQGDSTAGHRPLRLEALNAILDTLPIETCFVATTGYTARELASLRVSRGESGDRDFLVVGSMGHAASIALGMALARPETEVVCLDGDGSLAMHLGVMALIGLRRPSNLGHVLFNNGVHESVGGQPSAFAGTDAATVARGCGYRQVQSCRSLDALTAVLEQTTASDGPWFVEIKVRQGTLSTLTRPSDFSARVGRLAAAFQR